MSTEAPAGRIVRFDPAKARQVILAELDEMAVTERVASELSTLADERWADAGRSATRIRGWFAHLGSPLPEESFSREDVVKLLDAMTGSEERAEARPCSRCDGCGQLADTDDREPWTAWTDLPPKSSAAVLLGHVKPVPCDACGGTGRG